MRYVLEAVVEKVSTLGGERITATKRIHYSGE